MKHEEHEHIFDSINGFLEEQDERYPDEFKKGSKLSEVLEDIYAAKCRIIEAYPESEKDLFEVTDGYEYILRELCLKMADHVSDKK